MISIKKNSTEKFQDKLGNNIEINYTRITSLNNVDVAGRISKDEEEIGIVSMNEQANYVNVQLKSLAALTDDEIKTILNTAIEGVITLKNGEE